MKGIVPALNKIQLACMDSNAPLSAIGQARKQLFAAIREALVEAICISRIEGDCIITQSMVNREIKFLADFDKLNGG
jgi:hypothetical protein